MMRRLLLFLSLFFVGSAHAGFDNPYAYVTSDGTKVAEVKAASIAPSATDQALVTALSPNGNQATAANQTVLDGHVTSSQPRKMQDGAGNALTSQANGGQRALDVGVNVSGVQVDPRSIRALTSADVVTAAQGSPAATANAWPAKITDGTNVTAVKAASIAPGATDPALVVAISPNGKTVDTVGSTGLATLTRQDLSVSAASAGGTGATKDSAGLAQLSVLANVTAISGTGAYIQFHLQYSGDGTNWVTAWDSPRYTTTGARYFNAIRLSEIDYRYTYDIAGTTPSVTAAVTTTLKPVATAPQGQRFFYSDIDLATNGNQSSAFAANDCAIISVMLVRAAGGANATVQVFASNDQANWMTVSGSVAINPSTVNGATITAEAWRYYTIQVTSHASAGNTSDIQWSCN